MRPRAISRAVNTELDWISRDRCHLPLTNYMKVHWCENSTHTRFRQNKCTSDNRNCGVWRQHRGPLLKKREKWRTPSWLVPTIKGNPSQTLHFDVAHPPKNKESPDRPGDSVIPSFPCHYWRIVVSDS